ncbi:MAG: NAD(P)-dependent oxidoreductase [Actinomycetota bacterium]|nr:NAD(P)-dependent oxidoreductase [Actinomycetota bacterium]
MTTVAFCGLGQMGAPMAGRLIDAGCDVIVWNRTPNRTEPLAERGARVASSPAEAAKEAEAVFTMLATPEAVENVLFGDDGVAAGLAAGGGGGGDGGDTGGGGARTTVVEMSTIGREAVLQARDRLPEGVDLLDAPVLGSVSEAAEGELKIFVGGDEDVYRHWQPVLEHFGHPRYLGPLGSGAAMKLVTNWCLGLLMVGLGEALALADALGLSQADVLDVLAESPIGASVRSKRANIESDEWNPRFKLSLAAKDLRLVAEAADRAGLDLALLSGIRRRLDAAVTTGKGDSDYSVVIEDIRAARTG